MKILLFIDIIQSFQYHNLKLYNETKIHLLIGYAIGHLKLSFSGILLKSLYLMKNIESYEAEMSAEMISNNQDNPPWNHANNMVHNVKTQLYKNKFLYLS